MTIFDLLIEGQSLAMPYTDTGDVPLALKTQVSAVNVWTDEKWQGSDLWAKISPYRPARQKKGPGAAPSGEPIASHRNLIGFDAGMYGRLLDLGHSIGSCIHVAAGGTSLAVYALPPNGPGWKRQTRAWDAAKLSGRHGFDASHTLVHVLSRGQNDAGSDADSAAFGANLATYTAAVRAYWAPRVVRFVLVEISSTMVFGTSTQPRIDAVRAATEDFVDNDGGLSRLVDGTGFATFDDCHHTEAGSIGVGVACADAMVAF